MCTSARAPSAPGPKGVFILQTPVQGFRERVFSSQLFPFPGPADFRKWISHFQNAVPTDRQSKLCTDRSEEECWQGRGGVPAKGKKLAPVDVQVVSFKDNIEIGGRGEGPFSVSRSARIGFLAKERFLSFSGRDRNNSTTTVEQSSRRC